MSTGWPCRLIGQRRRLAEHGWGTLHGSEPGPLSEWRRCAVLERKAPERASPERESGELGARSHEGPGMTPGAFVVLASASGKPAGIFCRDAGHKNYSDRGY